MDSATLPPSPTPTQTKPRRSMGRWLISLIVLAAIGVGAWLFLRRVNTPTVRTPAFEEPAQTLEETVAQQRIANLVGIHLMLDKYKQQHGSYPSQLQDLTDIKGYAPAVAKMVSESKLGNGQPAYTYTKTDSSYTLCANQPTGEPKCEGPKR